MAEHRHQFKTPELALKSHTGAPRMTLLPHNTSIKNAQYHQCEAVALLLCSLLSWR